MSLLCVLGLGFAQMTWAPGEVSFDSDATKMLGPDNESLDAGYDSPANIQVRNDARQAAEKKANSGFKTWFSKPDPAKVAQAKAQAVALTFDQQHPTTPDEIAPNEIEGFDFTDFATKHERARNVAQAFRATANFATPDDQAAQPKPQPTPDEIPTPQADQAAQPKPQPTPEVQAALKTFGLDPNKSYSAQDIGTAFLSTADQLNQADPNRSTKFNALFDLRNLLLDNVRKNSNQSADQAAQPKPQPTADAKTPEIKSDKSQQPSTQRQATAKFATPDDQAAQPKPQPTPDEIPTPQADQAAQPKPQPTPEEVQAALKTFGLDPNKSYSTEEINDAFSSAKAKLNRANQNYKTQLEDLLNLRTLFLSSEQLTDVNFLRDTIITNDADQYPIALPLITPHITDPKTIIQLLNNFQTRKSGSRLILFIEALTPEQVTDPVVQKTLLEIAKTIKNKEYYTGAIEPDLKNALPKFDEAKFNAHLQSLLTPTADAKTPEAASDESQQPSTQRQAKAKFTIPDDQAYKHEKYETYSERNFKTNPINKAPLSEFSSLVPKIKDPQRINTLLDRFFKKDLQKLSAFIQNLSDSQVEDLTVRKTLENIRENLPDLQKAREEQEQEWRAKIQENKSKMNEMKTKIKALPQGQKQENMIQQHDDLVREIIKLQNLIGKSISFNTLGYRIEKLLEAPKSQTK